MCRAFLDVMGDDCYLKILKGSTEIIGINMIKWKAYQTVGISLSTFSSSTPNKSVSLGFSFFVCRMGIKLDQCMVLSTMH